MRDWRLTIAALLSIGSILGSTPAYGYISFRPCPPGNDSTNIWSCKNFKATVPIPNRYLHPEVVLIFWEDDASGPIWSEGLNQTNGTLGSSAGSSTGGGSNIGGSTGAAPAPGSTGGGFAGPDAPTGSSSTSGGGGGAPAIGSYGTWIGWTLSMINSPYFAGLSQYGGPSGEVTRPRLSAMAPIFQGPAPDGATTNDFLRTDLDTIIQQEVESGAVPAPSDDDWMLYVIIPPPGDSAQDCLNIGCNNSASFGTSTYDRIIIGNPWGGDPVGTLSHEISEAIPGVGVSGCTDNGTPTTVGLADVCCGATEQSNGLDLAAYYSEANHACIVPESWGPLEARDGIQGSWSEPTGGFNMAQVAGGAGGVVATAGSADEEQVYFYPAAGTKWLGEEIRGDEHQFWVAGALGPAGSELAAGGGILGVLGMDTQYSAISTYEVSQGWSINSAQLWKSLPPLPDLLPLTGIAITSRGVVGATDADGAGWEYPPGGPWTALTSDGLAQGGDQIVASGEDLLLLQQRNLHQLRQPLRENYVLSCPGDDPTRCTGIFETRTHGIKSIVSSPDSPYIGYVVEGSSGGLLVPSEDHVTQSQDFAVSGDSTGNFELIHGSTFSNPLESYACDDSHPDYCAGNAWTNTHADLGRLISGANLFGTQCSGTIDWCVNYTY